MSEQRIQSWDEFWPFYVGEHRVPLNRFLHIVGTSAGYGLVIAAAVLGDWRLLVAAPIVGYGNAWIGHFFVEKNKPASFSYPAWSFLGDMKMVAYAFTGRLGAEVERLYGSRSPERDAPLLVSLEA